MKTVNLLFPLFFIFISVSAQQKSIEEKIDSLLSIMTLEEKTGQMNQYSSFYDLTGPAPSEGDAAEKYKNLEKGLVGSMFNIRGAANVREIQRIAVEETRLGIPIIFGMDVIHGQKTIFPIPLGEAASWDLNAIKNSAHVAAKEASAMGINWTFAPMVDISRDPRWGRVMEGAGEDPYLGSRIAEARVKGFQGDNREDLSEPGTIAACAKHFAAYGFAEGGRDYNTVDIGTSTLYNVVLPPFKAAADAGVRTYMNSFNILNGIPATGNKFLLRDILKGEWEFDGFVVSDWSSGYEMITHGYAEDLEDATVKMANAGSDMDMENYAYIKHLKNAVESGKVDVSVVDDAVRRILRVKYELGLFDDPYRYCNEEREKELVGSPGFKAAARDMAKRSFVLLKNEGGLLPLDKDRNDILIIGALAEDKQSPLGNWSIAAERNSAVSVLEGMKKYGEYKYVRGVSAAIGDTNRSGFEEAINEAKSAGVVVMVLGERGYDSGEARSRADITLPGLQQELLKEVLAVNKNVVLALMNGRPLELTWEAENVPAILETWQPGTEGGNAIAEVLFGDYNPSGKLPVTFPRSTGQIPLYYNHFNTGRPHSDENPFTTGYLDESLEPLYPFGYGLSYTTYEYSGFEATPLDGNKINVKIKVTNSGNRAGEETVQVYIRDITASVVRPVKELKGFRKIYLEPGETKTAEFILTEKELGFYDNNGEFVFEPGRFVVMAGGNSKEVTGKEVVLR